MRWCGCWALGGGGYLLVESPYQYMPDSLERLVFDAQVAGFRPVLAHPERSGCFHERLPRLRALVERGVLTSITAGSVSGRYGKAVAAQTRAMLSGELVHDLASDGHGTERRLPRLSVARDRMGAELFDWSAEAVPAAMIAGREVPPPPAAPSKGRGLVGALRGLARRT